MSLTIIIFSPRQASRFIKNMLFTPEILILMPDAPLNLTCAFQNYVSERCLNFHLYEKLQSESIS